LRRRQDHTPTLFAEFLTTMLSATPGSAQEAEVVAAGRREFRQHCAVCHRLGGTGDSVMVNLNLLTVKPTDLTQLSKRNKGTFPFWQVYRIVDGREPVKGHGTSDMPIWGECISGRGRNEPDSRDPSKRTDLATCLLPAINSGAMMLSVMKCGSENRG